MFKSYVASRRGWGLRDERYATASERVMWWCGKAVDGREEQESRLDLLGSLHFRRDTW